MGLNFNNSDDQNLMPNQASPGPLYSVPADSNTTIHRKGVVTKLDLTGGLTSSRILQFGSKSSEGWLPGDIVFVSVPSHTGGGFTITIENIAGTILSYWQELAANGGMFVFDGGAYPGDFSASIVGGATDLSPLVTNPVLKAQVVSWMAPDRVSSAVAAGYVAAGNKVTSYTGPDGFTYVVPGGIGATTVGWNGSATGGKPAFITVNATNTALYSAAAGTTGNVPLVTYFLVEYPDVINFAGAYMLGNGTDGTTYTFGDYGAGTYFGNSASTPPFTTYGYTIQTTIHVVATFYDGTSNEGPIIKVDGQPLFGVGASGPALITFVAGAGLRGVAGRGIDDSVVYQAFALQASTGWNFATATAGSIAKGSAAFGPGSFDWSILSWLVSSFPSVAQSGAAILCVGTSLTGATNFGPRATSVANSYPVALQSILLGTYGKSVNTFNGTVAGVPTISGTVGAQFGFPGATMAQILSPFAHEYADLWYSPLWAQRICILEGGTNDVLTNVPAATIIANIQAIVASEIAAGAQIVFYTTIIDAGTYTAPQQAVRATVNAWLRTQAPLIDLDADFVANGITPTDATVYDVDREHLTVFGYQGVWAPLAAGVVAPYLH